MRAFSGLLGAGAALVVVDQRPSCLSFSVLRAGCGQWSRGVCNKEHSKLAGGSFAIEGCRQGQARSSYSKQPWRNGGGDAAAR